MEPTSDTKLGSLRGTLSRRDLLKAAGALIAATKVPIAFAQQPTGALSGTVWLYIGTYTGAPGAGSNGQGIYLCQLDLSTGKVTVLRLVAPALPAVGGTPATASPSTIALDPTGMHLYAGNEFGPPGAVSAYSIDRLTGDLTLLNVQPAVGAPAHVSVDHTGHLLFAAEYSGSYFEAFPILADGSLGPPVFQQQDLDHVGPKVATNAPPGSFAISAHEGPNGHPHQMEADPSNNWVLGPDVGQDRIYVWKLTPGGTPPLTPAAIPFVSTPPGDGPRHFAFHPNGNWMYSIQEEASTIMFWLFDSATGALSPQQIIPSVPSGFTGTDFASEIRVSADGDFVYGANRLSDTIGVFSIGHDGRLTQVGNASTLGDYPRIFAIDPSGRFMAVCNQRADNVTTFMIHRGGEGQGVPQGKASSMQFTGNYTPVGSPSGIVFLI
jgi:6-phosphogluconolactonase (cycloisomerase 2 family)